MLKSYAAYRSFVISYIILAMILFLTNSPPLAARTWSSGHEKLVAVQLDMFNLAINNVLRICNVFRGKYFSSVVVGVHMTRFWFAEPLSVTLPSPLDLDTAATIWHIRKVFFVAVRYCRKKTLAGDATLASDMKLPSQLRLSTRHVAPTTGISLSDKRLWILLLIIPVLLIIQVWY